MDNGRTWKSLEFELKGIVGPRWGYEFHCVFVPDVA